MEARNLATLELIHTNWISDADEMYATSGYMFLLGGGAVSCESASRPLIILVIMTITIWVFDVFNEMCAGIKERKCEQQRMTPPFSIVGVGDQMVV
jgi:hypothetical protein